MTDDRRAALDGLARILDAGAPEDLFAGADREAPFLYQLLVEATRARGSRYYWEICRTARRRGVSPEYVIDRASILLGAIDERRRTDLYRILGVPPLASGELIRQHWLGLAKTHHPDHGGRGERFQQAKQAYDVLRDPERRAEYERFWVRALAPFEPVVRPEDAPPVAPPERGGDEHDVPPVEARPAAPPEARAADDGDAVRSVAALVTRARALVRPISAAEIARLQAEVDGAIVRCEALRDQLAALARLQRACAAAPP